jgi:hypothetical protein
MPGQRVERVGALSWARTALVKWAMNRFVTDASIRALPAAAARTAASSWPGGASYLSQMLFINARPVREATP